MKMRMAAANGTLECALDRDIAIAIPFSKITRLVLRAVDEFLPALLLPRNPLGDEVVKLLGVHHKRRKGHGFFRESAVCGYHALMLEVLVLLDDTLLQFLSKLRDPYVLLDVVGIIAGRKLKKRLTIELLCEGVVLHKLREHHIRSECGEALIGRLIDHLAGVNRLLVVLKDGMHELVLLILGVKLSRHLLGLLQGIYRGRHVKDDHPVFPKFHPPSSIAGCACRIPAL